MGSSGSARAEAKRQKGGGTKRPGAKKAEREKDRARKSGAPLPQPVKPAGGRRPASSLFTLDYSDLAAA